MRRLLGQRAGEGPPLWQRQGRLHNVRLRPSAQQREAPGKPGQASVAALEPQRRERPRRKPPRMAEEGKGATRRGMID